MQIELDEKEWLMLLQLSLLGEYVVNASRGGKETLREYRELTDKLCRRQYEQTNRISDSEAIEENEIADVHDKIFDTVSQYLEAFEQDVLKENGVK